MTVEIQMVSLNIKKVFKSSTLIQEIFHIKTKRDLIEKHLSNNHTKSLSLTPEFDLICLNYNLEMDILSTSNSKEVMCNYLNLTPPNRTVKYLLTKRENRIKDIDVLLNVINNSEKRNLPFSYRHIIKRFEKLK